MSLYREENLFSTNIILRAPVPLVVIIYLFIYFVFLSDECWNFFLEGATSDRLTENSFYSN